jgi:hypothetical protein
MRIGFVVQRLSGMVGLDVLADGAGDSVQVAGIAGDDKIMAACGALYDARIDDVEDLLSDTQQARAERELLPRSRCQPRAVRLLSRSRDLIIQIRRQRDRTLLTNSHNPKVAQQ